MTTINIEKRDRTNSRGETYPQYFVDDELVGCACREALAVTVEKYHFKPCHHIRDARATLAITGEDLQPHIEDELRGSCCQCGGYTTRVICYNCIR